MPFLLFVAVVLMALVVAANAYWLALLIKYPEPISANEVHAVKTADLWQIKLFRCLPEGGGGEPVLLCHGAFGNHFNFGLPPGESLLDTLVGRGYDCWLVDLRGCRSAVPPFGRTKAEPTIDDYLLRDLPVAIEYIRKTTGYGQVHWVGHSMGGILLYAYEQVFGADNLASGVTLGSPVGFEGVPYRSQRWLLPFFQYARPLLGIFIRSVAPLSLMFRPKWTVFPVNWDNVHPRIDGGFFFHGLDVLPPRIAEELDLWASGSPWCVSEDDINVLDGLSKLHVPLLAVYGAADPLVPVGKAMRFIKTLANPDKRLLVLGKANGHTADYSHVDLVFGRNGKKEVYEPIAAWLRKHPITQRLGKETGKPVRMRAAQAGQRAKVAEKRKPRAKKKRAAAPKAKASRKAAARRKKSPSGKRRARPKA